MRIRSDSYDFGLKDVNVPLQPRPISEHRLLAYDAATGKTSHTMMTHLAKELDPGDLLVFNNSKVMPVALYLSENRFVLLVEPAFSSLENVRIICPFKPKVGEIISFGFGSILLKAHEPGWDVYRADIRTEDGTSSLQGLIEKYGKFPLPIYIKREPTSEDESALQNHFATVEGSIAPPVAGTHFDPELMRSLRASGMEISMVTLHVGYGTFRSFKSEYIDSHVMDGESYSIGCDTIRLIDIVKRRGNRVIAVGTTAARVLETVGQFWSRVVEEGKDVAGITEIFIRPPYNPVVVDGLITNFQYPKLPVIAMAATFVGLERLRDLYMDAYVRQYMFYSLGDAMLLKF